jgi:UTP--glucose-1-phosphate uridylyltransferase
MKIRKAILPVAGLGTRFLPATKAQPKEMLPVVDKPVIQYIVEEAVASGIEQIIFVTSMSKRAIDDHFDRNFELEYRLREKGKEKELKQVQHISELAKFVYVRQPAPLGDGHAILQTRELIGNEPCAVMFGDDIIDSKEPVLSQLMQVYEKYGDPVVAIEEVPKSEIHKYGIVDGTEVEKGTVQAERLIEKPRADETQSNLAIVGRYIITPELFNELAALKPGKDGEIRLADALSSYLKSRPVYAHKFNGVRYDCGNKLQFLIASVMYGMRHTEVGEEFKHFLKKLF